MSNRATTQYNHLNVCKSIINDLFSIAKSFKLTHNDLLKRRTEKLFNSNSYKRLTQRNKSYISGMLDCLHNGFYQYLIWGWNIEGKFYPKYDLVPKKFKMLVTNKTIEGHFWYKDDTSKIFS